MELVLTSNSQFIGDTMCGWHPLTKEVNYVLRKYYSFTQEDSLKTNFIEKLNYLRAHSHEDDLFKIFDALDITCYNGLVLFKYKNIIVLEDLGYQYEDFFSYYDGIFKECRSVVFDESNGCIAMASLAKFKNYGEDREPYKQWSIENLNRIYKESFKFYITNKMDGSYQQYTYDKKRNKIIGSGSSALDTEVSWRLKEGFKLLRNPYKDLIYDFPDWTFVFEFIHPDNPIVVHYIEKDKGLYLIGARNKYTGQEMDFNILQAIVNYYNENYDIWDENVDKGIQMVHWYGNENLDSILSQTSKYSSNEKEGWVVDCWSYDFPFNHLRFKIKIDDYILMHRALSKMISPNAIIQSLADDKWDDFYSKVPVAYKDYANKLKNEILEYKKIIVKFYASYCHSIPYYEDKKDAMIWIQNNTPKFIRSYVINYYLNRESSVLKNHGGGYKKRNELKELAEKCQAIRQDIYESEN